MMKFYEALFICLAVLSSFAAKAECSKVEPFHTITIQPDANGQPVVDNKGNQGSCKIHNNRKTSYLQWVFLGLNCDVDRCQIKFEGDNSLLKNAYACEKSDPNYFVCTLKVNKTKAYCNKHNHSSDTTACEAKYDIWVGNQKIDPSIIIRPRPTA